MPILDAGNLFKIYGHQQVLGAVLLSIEAGKRITLVVANGSGKSAFGRIFTRIDRPDGGLVAVFASPTFRRSSSSTYQRNRATRFSERGEDGRRR